MSFPALRSGNWNPLQPGVATNRTIAAGAVAVTITNPSALLVVGDVVLAGNPVTVTVTAPVATLLAQILLSAGANVVTFESPTSVLVPGDPSLAAGETTVTFTAPTAFLDANIPEVASRYRYAYRVRAGVQE